MGAFYGNITLKGPSQKSIAQSLHRRRAVVAPTVGDYTVAFDSVCDDQDSEALQALTARLSSDLHCSALAVIVHDDDVFAYFHYQDGELADWYNSCPSYFDFDSAIERAGPAGGNAERLCAAFGVDTRHEVDSILRQPPGKSGYAFETERHSDLFHVLGMPAFAVGKALASFDRGEYPDGLSADQMLWAADAPSVEEDRQRRLDRQLPVWDGATVRPRWQQAPFSDREEGRP
jgi:hypothetical protein